VQSAKSALKINHLTVRKRSFPQHFSTDAVENFRENMKKNFLKKREVKV